MTTLDLTFDRSFAHPFVGLRASGMHTDPNGTAAPTPEAGAIVSFGASWAWLLADDGRMVHVYRVVIDDPAEATRRLNKQTS